MNRSVPILVAHRGYPARFPENSLEGVDAALKAGACFVEFDVQLSADGVPIVIHDQDLNRTAGLDISVFDKSYSELRQFSVGEPDRFGDVYRQVKLPSLAEMIRQIMDWPHAQAFVEIKRASLRRFGHQTVIDRVLEIIEPARDRCIVISFDSKVVEQIKHIGPYRTGWAIKAYNKSARDRANAISPDFLFINNDLLPPVSRGLWRSSWQWVVYTLDDPGQILNVAERGVTYVETNAIGEVLPVLQQGAQQ